jgi:hypothetical protein
MRTDFEDDPENGRKEMPYYLYGLVFVVCLAIAVAIGWLLYLQRLGVEVR